MDTSTNQTLCKNCGNAIVDAYCGHCGQRDIESGITIRHTIEEFLSTNFSIEGSATSTLRLLLLNPGRLFRDFIAGKRKSYYKPIQFFLVASLIYLAFAELTNYDPLEGEFPKNANTENQREFVHYGKLAAEFMVANISNVLFILCFSFAAVMKLFGRKKQRFAEYLAIGFYITGMYVLTGLVTVTLAKMGLGSRFLNFAFLGLYTSYACISFWGGFTVMRLLKALLVATLSWVLYLILSFGLAYLIVWIKHS